MKLYETCIRCGKKLTGMESKERGFGKACWAKYNKEHGMKRLFVMEGVNESKEDSSTDSS